MDHGQHNTQWELRSEKDNKLNNVLVKICFLMIGIAMGFGCERIIRLFL